MGFFCWDCGDEVGFALAKGMIIFGFAVPFFEVDRQASEVIMKFRTLTVLLMLLTACLPAMAWAGGCRPRPFTGAGVLPYAKVGGRTLLLLGYETGRGWLSFGGKPKMVRALDDAGPRCETYLETAAREGFEEMRRMVGYREILAAIDAQRYFPRSAGPEAFRTYTIQIAHAPAAAFRQIATPSESDYDEIDDYYWIDLETLTRIVTAGERLLPQSPNSGQLWKAAFSDLGKMLGNEALRRQLFP